MTSRQRIASFGVAVALVAGGIVSAVAVTGTTGQVLALVLIGVGLVLVVSLVFLEVGLGEDRERARLNATSRDVRAPKAQPRPRRTTRPRTRDHR